MSAKHSRVSGSHKPSERKRLLKIAGEKRKTVNIRKERFNEDAESVAKSIREDLSQKLKYNLLNSGSLPGNNENKSVVTGLKSKTSRFQSSNGKQSKTSRLRAGSITASKKALPIT